MAVEDGLSAYETQAKLLARLLPLWLTSQEYAKARGDGSGSEDPATHGRVANVDPGSWHRPRPALAVVGISAMNQQVEGLALFLILCHSAFRINR